MTNNLNQNTNEVIDFIAEMLIQNLITESEASFAEKLVQTGDISSDAGLGEIFEAII